MRVFNRKSQLERMLETLTNVPSKMKFDMPSGASGKALKAGLITTGGLAGLTAVSAGISSHRRQSKGTGGDS